MDDSYIAVDWGSTHLRAWLINEGMCCDTLHLPYGVTRLGDQPAADLFERYLAPWRGERLLPCYLAGMVGSDAGWQSVPYLSCPQKLTALAHSLTAVADKVWIIPGLKLQSDGECNVMRGEETLLLGAMMSAPADCVVLPGTHSKWVQMAADSVERFATALTGELHHLLINHSLLGRGLPPQRTDEAAFMAGAACGLEQPELVSTLFGVRARRVLGELLAEEVSEYLSGLLIGSEVATLSQRYHTRQVTLIASESLENRYHQVLTHVGLMVQTLSPEQAFLRGIKHIHDKQ